MPTTEYLEADVFVTKVWPPKGKYFAFNCAELVSDDNKYGRMTAPISVLSKIKEQHSYRIKYHVTDEGYFNFDTIITDIVKDPPPRPATNPKDALRMGAHGSYNAILSSIEGMTLSDWLDVDVKHLSALLLKCYQVEDRVDKFIVADLFKDNPPDIMTGKRKQKSEDLDDEIPM